MTDAILRQAAKMYGTPLYLFDLDLLRQRAKTVRGIQKGGSLLCYAMKANPFLTEKLLKVTDRIEVCSPGELRICRSQKIPMEKVIFSGVLKEEADLRELLSGENKLPLFTAESAAQAELLTELAEEYGRWIELLPRLTSKNQFGMDLETIIALIRRSEKHKAVKIKGIHFYSGTQKKKAKQVLRELQMLDAACKTILEQTGQPVGLLEYGPGLGMEYFKEGGEKRAEEEFSVLKELCADVKELSSVKEVTLELGRFLAADCGSYLTSVREVKANSGTNYCIVDGGMHHMNYDGQIMAMKTPFCHAILSRRGGAKIKYDVCGALCTANDILVKQYPFEELYPGDLLVFERTGAYSMTEGMSLFLSRNLPAVVGYDKEGGFTLMRPETPTYGLNMPAAEGQRKM